jgi:hypothetical protein
MVKIDEKCTRSHIIVVRWIAERDHHHHRESDSEHRTKARRVYESTYTSATGTDPSEEFEEA